MNYKRFWIGLAFLLGIIVLSVIDIGLNAFSLIPGVGDVLETATETVIELLQITIAGIGLFVIGSVEK